MFDAKRLLFLYVETPLHAGSGRGLGAVDLPIQRERLTGYPMVQASGLKGCLRATARERKMDNNDLEAIFGPEADPSAHAGALAVGDARLILFPVRSLAGVFAYTTSVDALARFQRAAETLDVAMNWRLPSPPPDDDTACVTGSTLQTGAASVVLEDFSFAANDQQADALKQIGGWIADHVAANGSYWHTALQTKLCLLPDSAFSDFAQHATEIQTHVKLNRATKTAAEGALFTSENLPTDTVLYAPLMATQSRRNGHTMSAQGVFDKLDGLNLKHLQLGGDETTGQGVVSVAIAGGSS